MSRTLRLIIGGLVLLVIIVLVWFFLINPVRSDIAAVKTSIEDERTALTAAQAQVAAAQATREEGAKNRGRLLELAKMVPETDQIPSLLLQIQDLAEQSGIEFTAVTPGSPVESGGFEMIPLQLEFTGTYFDLSDFVYRAEQMVAGPGRLLAVKTVDLQLGDVTEQAGSTMVAGPELKVNMTMYAFEMAAAGAAGTQAPAGSSSGATTTSTTTGGS